MRAYGVQVAWQSCRFPRRLFRLILLSGVGLLFLAAGAGALHARAIAYNEDILSDTVPRSEGGVGEQQAVSFIVDELERMGITYKIDDFSHYVERFSHSQNVYAYINGVTDNTVVLAAALNRPSSYSISLLLHMIERYRLSQPETNLVFAFLGADYWQNQYIGIGSQLLIDSLSSFVVDMLLYVNIDYDPDVWEVDIGTTYQVTQRYGVELMIDSAREAGKKISIPAFWRTTFGGERDRLFAEEDPSFASPTDLFLHKGIQALTISAETLRRSQQSYASVNVISTFIARIADVYLATDSNYLLFPIGRMFYVVGEQVIVRMLLALIVLILCVGYYSKGSLRKQYTPLVKQNILIFLINIAVLFASVYSSQFVIESIFSFFPIVDIWRYVSFVALIMKITVSIALYVAFNTVLKPIETPENSKVYSAFALILGAASQLTALVNLFLATVTAWLFLGTMCFVLAKSAKHKAVIFYTTLAVPIGFLFPYFIWTPVHLHQAIIFSGVTNSLLVAIIILPYFFMYFRIRALGARVMNKTVGSTILVVCIACATLFFIVYDPFVRTVPQDITIVEEIDQEIGSHTVAYRSNLNKETYTSLYLNFATKYIIVTPRINERIVTFPYHPVYQIEHSAEIVGDYHFYVLTIEGELGVQLIDIVLKSVAPLNIVNSDTPYTNINDNTVQFHTGRGPMLPLEIGFYLPASSSTPIIVEALVTPSNTVINTDVQASAYGIRDPRPYTLDAVSSIAVKYTLDL